MSGVFIPRSSTTPSPFPQENLFCIKLGLFSTISLCRKVVEIKTVNLLLLLLCYRCFFFYQLVVDPRKKRGVTRRRDVAMILSFSFALCC